MLAAGNLGGRIGWAAFSDKVGRRLTFNMFCLGSIPLYLAIPYTVQQVVGTGVSGVGILLRGYTHLFNRTVVARRLSIGRGSFWEPSQRENAPTTVLRCQINTYTPLRQETFKPSTFTSSLAPSVTCRIAACRVLSR